MEPGKTLAFVGPSGSGKSTTLSLLEKFYKLTSGSIMLDGSEIKHLKDSWLRQQISLVSQEPVLFDMSIADNIRYGANFREVTDEEIQEAAKSANIHDFIISLSEVLCDILAHAVHVLFFRDTIQLLVPNLVEVRNNVLPLQELSYETPRSYCLMKPRLL